VFDPEFQTHEWVKDLRKVRKRGFRLEQVLVVDDTASKLSRSYGNLVRIRPYDGGAEDEELKILMPYLLELKEAANVRAIQKREWRVKGA
jgi:RNA polymerase II subunit A small phosphatase-like protein